MTPAACGPTDNSDVPWDKSALTAVWTQGKAMFIEARKRTPDAVANAKFRERAALDLADIEGEQSGKRSRTRHRRVAR